ASCTQTAPCQSFKRAYALAQAGDIVDVGPGSYGPQVFAGGDGSQAKGTKAVTFRCQPGAKMQLLSAAGDNLTYDGCDVDAGGTKTLTFMKHGSSDVTPQIRTHRTS